MSDTATTRDDSKFNRIVGMGTCCDQPTLLFGKPLVFAPGMRENQWYLKELTDEDVVKIVTPKRPK